MSTPIVPIMDNLYLETFFFFVPDRLLWDNFQKFMGEQLNPGDSIDYLIPQASVGSGSGSTDSVEVGSLEDYFGIPTGINAVKFNALPLRAYYTIWNEFFRDQNLQDTITVNKGDTGIFDLLGEIPNGFKNPRLAGSCLPRGKRHDYFTSCLTSPQKFEALRIPLTGNAPVFGNGKSVGFTDGSNNYGLIDETDDNGGSLNIWTGAYDKDVNVSGRSGTSPSNSKTVGLVTSGESGLYADLSEVTAATINDLRTAFQIQRLLESQNRSGTRYIEILAGQFGTWSGDARLQRPEYLGGSSARININPVMQTSATTSSDYTPQGNLAAYGVCADRVNGFVKSFVEHGYIIGLVNVRADLNYQHEHLQVQ